MQLRFTEESPFGTFHLKRTHTRFRYSRLAGEESVQTVSVSVSGFFIHIAFDFVPREQLQKELIDATHVPISDFISAPPTLLNSTVEGTCTRLNIISYCRPLAGTPLGSED